MFKPSILGRLAICQRFITLVVLWSLFLVGANEVRLAADGDSTVYEGIKRLAVYSMTLRAHTEP